MILFPLERWLTFEVLLFSCSCGLEMKKTKKYKDHFFPNVNFCMLLCISGFAVWLLWYRVAGSSSSSQPLLCNICINCCVWATTLAVAVVLLEQLSCKLKLFRLQSLLWYNATRGKVLSWEYRSPRKRNSRPSSTRTILNAHSPNTLFITKNLSQPFCR